MKTFSELRGKPQGKKVYSKPTKIGRKRVSVEIYKHGNEFVAYVDGDRLDAFKSQKDAEKGITAIVKELS